LAIYVNAAILAQNPNRIVMQRFAHLLLLILSRLGRQVHCCFNACRRTSMHIHRSLSLLAIAALFFVSGCKEEQVLYETDRASTAGPAGTAPTTTAALPNAPAATGALKFERPPERTQLTPDKLKTHTAAGLEFVFAREWVFKLSNSPMRAAEISMPAANEADGGVEVVVFYFGQGQGGTAEANITRWIGQVEPMPGWPPTLYQSRPNGLVVSEVVVRGNYTPTAMGPAAPAPTPIKDAVLYGIVAEGGPLGSVFIRATGTIKAMDAARPGLETMVQLLRPVVAE
jgi:hypothetical protein